MRFGKLLLCTAALLGAAACGDDDGVSNSDPLGPDALVRFVNVGQDMGTVDLRFPDLVENLPTLQGVNFRASSGFYQRTRPGARPARIFPTSANVDTTQMRLVDTTVTFLEDTRYTLVYAGRAANNQDQLAVLTDERTPATPPAGNVAIKVLHAATGAGNVDVYITPATAGANNASPIANAVAVVRNVPYLGSSAYVNVPARPISDVASTETLYQYTVTAAGSTTAMFTVRPTAAQQQGAVAPAGVTYGAQPGVGIPGSVLTVVVAPGAVAGSRGATATNQTPSVFVIADKVCAVGTGTGPTTTC